MKQYYDIIGDIHGHADPLETLLTKLGYVAIDGVLQHHYASDNPPVFVGYYWLNDDIPSPLADNCACLDYSIAKGGKLVAYCWRGERTLKESNFYWDN